MQMISDSFFFFLIHLNMLMRARYCKVSVRRADITDRSWSIHLKISIKMHLVVVESLQNGSILNVQ